MLGRGVLGLAAPFFMGRAVDVIIVRAGMGELGRYIILLVAFSASTAVAQWWMRWLWIGWSRHAERRVRDHGFAHIIRLPLGFFHRSRTGDILSRLTSDVEAVRMGYGPGIMHCAHPVFMTAGAIVLMLATSPLLTAVSMAPMVLLFLTMRGILPSIHQRAMRVQERQGELTTRAQESFSGARVVKAFAREPYEIDRFQVLSQGFLRDSLEHAKRRGLFQCLIEMFAGLGSLIVFFTAGRLVVDRVVTVGDYVAFTGYLNLLIWPMIALGWTLALFKRAEASAERIQKLRDEPAEIGLSDGPIGLPPRGELSIRNLTYTYPGAAQPALVDVDLEAPAGSTVGIVGATASGKSTLVNLLQRLHDPPPGTVFLDGVDVLDLPLPRVRGAFAVVSQESFLFSDTLRNNVTFGRDDATDAEVQRALHISCLDDEIATFPDGIDTRVGERGVTLSGGQRQRTSIARALLMDAPILILDDALSAVDTETEQRILFRLRPEMAQRTALIVAHRLSSVQDVDHIIVLAKGRVLERGTHADLLALDGTYAALWRMQQEERELEQL